MTNNAELHKCWACGEDLGADNGDGICCLDEHEDYRLCCTLESQGVRFCQFFSCNNRVYKDGYVHCEQHDNSQ